MGTRADFYVGRGAAAEWIGSVAMDGYPDGIPDAVKTAEGEEKFRGEVADFLDVTNHASKVSDGWPWPWEDSKTTDYAYAFDGGKVHASGFGHAWFDPTKPEPESDDDSKPTVFPNMKDKQRVTMGRRSGLIVIAG